MGPSGLAQAPLVVANLAGLGSGGAVTYLRGVAYELLRRPHNDVRWRLLITAEQRALIDGEDRPGVEFTVLPKRGPAARMGWEQLVLPRARMVEPASVLVAAANFGRGRKGLPCVVIAHNALHFSDFRQPGWSGRRLMLEASLARCSVRRAAAAVAPSEAMARRICAQTDVAPAVLPFGPGLGLRFRAPTGDRFTFIHRTSWGPHKRFGTLLEAVRQLALRRPRAFRLHSACDPRTPFAQRWPEGRADAALLSDAAVRQHVEIAGPAPGEQVIEASAAVIPSDVESFCFPLAEALAGGLPAVAADADYAREMCGEAAFYAAPGDAAGLAQAMERLLDGERPLPAPRGWSDRYSWAAHVDGLAELCRGVAKRPLGEPRIGI